MKYENGVEAQLGDLVEIPMPDGTHTGRVVMLGKTQEHLRVDENYLSFILSKKLLAKDAVVVEWVGSNPLAHEDSTLAPVGNYMTTHLFDCRKQQ